MSLVLMIEPTDEFRRLALGPDGHLKARIWQGVADDGTPVHLLVATVAVHTEEPGTKRFAERLTETSPLTARTRQVFDLRYFLD